MYDSDFDRQKLQFHPREVAHWLETDMTPGPLYTEMELSTICNQRCAFCGVDYVVNRRKDLADAAMAIRTLHELREMGNKSVMFSGHGEPLTNPAAAEIIAASSRLMSTSLTTNGTLLDASRLDLIDGLKWVRFSVNGGDAADYARIHRTGEEMFDRVTGCIEGAVQRKRSLGLEVAIGVQLVLLPENADGAAKLAAQMREIGVDYFSVKPYSQHPLRNEKREIDYAPYAHLEAELNALARDDFRIAFRGKAMAEVGRAKNYRQCLGTHFLGYISANGDVWECNDYAGDPRFWLGNLNELSLKQIWTGERRREVLRFIAEDLDLAQCRDRCRLHECNNYLWRLTHPWAHDDFI